MPYVPEKRQQEGVFREDAKKNSDTRTIIFFDWDDTLCPSTFLSLRGYDLEQPPARGTELWKRLRVFEKVVIRVLEQAFTFGDVHVLTNAKSGWVEMSTQSYIPAVQPYLSRMKIISARSTYEQMHPEMPMRWKFCAFQHRLQAVFSRMEMKTDKNILSFGDSHVEREALRLVTRGLPNTRTKSIKFAEHPSLEQLRRQLELVTQSFDYLCSHSGDLDLQLTVTVNVPPAPTQMQPKPRRQVDRATALLQQKQQVHAQRRRVRKRSHNTMNVMHTRSCREGNLDVMTLQEKTTVVMPSADGVYSKMVKRRCVNVASSVILSGSEYPLLELERSESTDSTGSLDSLYSNSDGESKKSDSDSEESTSSNSTQDRFGGQGQLLPSVDSSYRALFGPSSVLADDLVKRHMQTVIQ